MFQRFGNPSVDISRQTGYKNATTSVVGGVSLQELALLATEKMRMRNASAFVERDSKIRFVVNPKVDGGLHISFIFSAIEEKKDRHKLSDYGVSQTSLEQVFNMHAVEAEKLKIGTNDG